MQMDPKVACTLQIEYVEHSCFYMEVFFVRTNRLVHLTFLYLPHRMYVCMAVVVVLERPTSRCKITYIFATKEG